MNDGGSHINLGELSKPATVLIEKIAEATGGIFRPFQIRRVAQAEADADKIRASAKIEISDLERRAMHRFLHEEAKKQNNIESITQKALPTIEDEARPQEIEDDWITNFFDKCRIISDEQMQNLWSKVLSGEANSPGRFSKRTINLLASFDKADAELFNTLCSFVCYLGDEPIAFIYDPAAPIYTDAGINYTSLRHLETIGLLLHETDQMILPSKLHLPSEIVLTYFGTRAKKKFQKSENNTFPIGRVYLSKAGQELALVCSSTPREGFKEYVFSRWGGERAVTEI